MIAEMRTIEHMQNGDKDSILMHDCNLADIASSSKDKKGEDILPRLRMQISDLQKLIDEGIRNFNYPEDETLPIGDTFEDVTVRTIAIGGSEIEVSSCRRVNPQTKPAETADMQLRANQDAYKILIVVDGELTIFFPHESVPMGMVYGMQKEETEVKLAKGDILIIFSPTTWEILASRDTLTYLYISSPRHIHQTDIHVEKV